MHFECSNVNGKTMSADVDKAPSSNNNSVDSFNHRLQKVLVVDDLADLADVTADLLTAHGISASAVYSADEALRVLENDAEVNIVFSDVMMPEMTGLDLGEVIRARYPQIKVILTSGYFQQDAMTGRLQKFLFVPKPYRIDAVLKQMCA